MRRLQQASLTPSSSSSLPPPAQSTCSAGRSDPTHTTPPNAPVQPVIGSRPARQPLAPPLPVLTPSLSGWLRAFVGTRQPLPALAEKRLSGSRRSNQSLLKSALERARRSGARHGARGGGVAASGVMEIRCLCGCVYRNELCEILPTLHDKNT